MPWPVGVVATQIKRCVLPAKGLACTTATPDSFCLLKPHEVASAMVKSSMKIFPPEFVVTKEGAIHLQSKANPNDALSEIPPVGDTVNEKAPTLPSP